LRRTEKVTHPLHIAVGTRIAEADLSDCAVVRDPACGGSQNIPLFCDSKKSNSTEYCDVDIIILKDKRARVIIEIEEANVTPVQVCGKFLASALSSYFIHQKWGSLEMGDSVLFIQTLDASKLRLDRTSKMVQWNRVEQSIRGIIPIKGSRICDYRLFQGTIEDFTANSERSKALVGKIQSFLAGQY
jgi:hypothetical protein